MVPTLKALDQVYVTPDRRFEIGDVIVFKDPDSGRMIVHRVLSVKEGRIVTRGDNNAYPDSSIVSPGKVLGRVTHIRRNRKVIKVRGGWVGMAVIVPYRVWLKLRRHAVSMAILPYHALSRSGIFRIWLPGSLRPHTMSYNGANGPELRVMMGKRLAGVWRSGYPEWRIIPPYRLFLDENALPAVPLCNRACSAEGVSANGRSDDKPGK